MSKVVSRFGHMAKLNYGWLRNNTRLFKIKVFRKLDIGGDGIKKKTLSSFKSETCFS